MPENKEYKTMEDIKKSPFGKFTPEEAYIENEKRKKEFTIIVNGVIETIRKEHMSLEDVEEMFARIRRHYNRFSILREAK